MHHPAVDAPGHVPLRGHRVEVAGEEDRRGGLAVEEHLAVVVERLSRDETAYEGEELGLVAALGGDVDELEGAGGDAGG